MACVYEAPDAEAVRATQRTGKLPFDRIWPAHHLPASEPPPRREGYVTVVVQREMPVAVDVAMVMQLSVRSMECLKLRNGAPIESLLSHDGLRMMCAFVAPDAEAVREANAEAGLPMTRAWPATRL
jgi:hypothetical protein